MELTEQTKLEILCAYLPYGVEVRADKAVYKGFIAPLVLSNNTDSFKNGYTIAAALDYGVQPILRHPDDMTEEEFDKLCRIIDYPDSMDVSYFLIGMYGMNLKLKEFRDCIKYLHSIHIDTFGAIEAGWAVRKEVSNG